MNTLNPLNLTRPSSSRYPDLTPRISSGVHPSTVPDVPPLPAIPSQGGWADRFFAHDQPRSLIRTPSNPASSPQPSSGRPAMRGSPTESAIMPPDRSTDGRMLRITNRDSEAIQRGQPGLTQPITPFIRVDSPSDRSSTSSIASRSLLPHVTLQTTAQPKTLTYGHSYAHVDQDHYNAPDPQDCLTSPALQSTISPLDGPTPHASTLFEYDGHNMLRGAPIERAHSIARSAHTHSVYSTTSEEVRESMMAAAPAVPARHSAHGGLVVMRGTMTSGKSLLAPDSVYTIRSSGQWQGMGVGAVGDGVPRAL